MCASWPDIPYPSQSISSGKLSLIALCLSFGRKSHGARATYTHANCELSVGPHTLPHCYLCPSHSCTVPLSLSHRAQRPRLSFSGECRVIHLCTCSLILCTYSKTIKCSRFGVMSTLTGTLQTHTDTHTQACTRVFMATCMHACARTCWTFVLIWSERRFCICAMQIKV